MQIAIDTLLRHLWVIGASGVGKSTALLSWLTQLVAQGYGVGLLDPNSDLFRDFRAVIARTLREREWDRVILLDPLDPTSAIGFNPLELKPGEFAERKAAFLAGVVNKVFKIDPLIAARMQQIMLHTFWLLMRFDLTLVEFPLVLTHPAVRLGLVNRLPSSDYLLKSFWENEFPNDNERLVQEWTQSSLSKIRPLVTDPALRRIFGQQRSTLDFRRIMDERGLLLVNLSKGQLGGEKSQLLGTFLCAQIQLAALSRDQLDRRQRRQWLLAIDEFQNMLTEDIEEILVESRKYGLSILVANQHLGQLADYPKLQQAILNTVQNWAVFRVGAADAAILAPDLFNPGLDQAKDVHVRKNPTGLPWFPYTTVHDTVWRPWAEIQEQQARKLRKFARYALLVSAARLRHGAEAAGAPPGGPTNPPGIRTRWRR